MADRAPAESSYFVTGFPGFIGKRLVQHICGADAAAKVFALVHPKQVQDAQRELKRTGLDVELLLGDVGDMHLGLSGAEYERLCEQVTHIYHLAAVSHLAATRDQAWRTNVDGTRNVIELGHECSRLKRFSYFSTCLVAGDRVGVIAEDELDQGQAFRNVYEEAKFHAEKLVHRAAKRLPVSIFRPSTVVGDSKTGEVDRFEGPYYLGILLVMSPLSVPLPLPGNGVAPLNVVPVDFVVQAVWQLSRDPRGEGRTFHLVDPNPMSARRVYEIIAERNNKRLPKFRLSARATDAVLRLPFLEKVARSQRAAISSVNHLALYNCHNTLELLDGTGIRCPPLSTYLNKLVDYVRDAYRRQRDEVEVEDPLDRPPAAARSGRGR